MSHTRNLSREKTIDIAFWCHRKVFFVKFEGSVLAIHLLGAIIICNSQNFSCNFLDTKFMDLFSFKRVLLYSTFDEPVQRPLGVLQLLLACI